jgi:hypothetical protein
MASYGQYDWTQGQLILKKCGYTVGEIRLPWFRKSCRDKRGRKISFRKIAKSEK